MLAKGQGQSAMQYFSDARSILSKTYKNGKHTNIADAINKSIYYFKF